MNYSQTVGELQANAFGVMNQLARIMHQPAALGMMGSVAPLMSQPNMMMPPGAAGVGYAGDVAGPGGRRYDGRPPAKMMRMADTGTFSFSFDRNISVL